MFTLYTFRDEHDLPDEQVAYTAVIDSAEGVRALIESGPLPDNAQYKLLLPVEVFISNPTSLMHLMALEFVARCNSLANKLVMERDNHVGLWVQTTSILQFHKLQFMAKAYYQYENGVRTLKRQSNSLPTPGR